MRGKGLTLNVGWRYLFVFALGHGLGVFVSRISILDVIVSSATETQRSMWNEGSTAIGASLTSSQLMSQDIQSPFWTIPRNGLRPVFVFSKASQPSFKSYSQVGQDVLILKLVQKHVLSGGESGRYFIDLAANDAIELSNTFHLEQNGWQGLCLEPNPIYWYGLSAFRNCLVLGSFVGGTDDGTEVNVSLSNGVFGGIVGLSKPNTENDLASKKMKIEKRNLLTISTALSIANPPKVIDYLSLDVEGAEHIVMENFPFHEYKVRFATVELSLIHI